MIYTIRFLHMLNTLSLEIGQSPCWRSLSSLRNMAYACGTIRAWNAAFCA